MREEQKKKKRKIREVKDNVIDQSSEKIEILG